MNKKRKYKINVYYSTFYSYEVNAKNEEEAFEKIKDLYVNKDEILDNLERWQQADTIEEIENDRD